MSEYPRIAFPTHTRRYNREKQRVFTDHGCIEAVHVDLFEKESAVFARRHRPTLQSSDSILTQNLKVTDERILAPVHGFLTLGDPEPFETIQEDDVIPSALVKERKTTNDCRKAESKVSKPIYTFSVTDNITNFLHDHPEAAYGTLAELVDECGAQKSGSVYMRKSLEHLDPTLCDIGRKMLTDFVGEETQANTLRHYCDRDYTGGCLSYKSLGRSTNKETGVIFCPQGQALDELSVKLLSIDCDKLRHGNAGDVCVTPNIELGPEIRQTLNGRVLQVEVAPYKYGNSLPFAARSDYYLYLSKFKCPTLDDWDDHKIEFDKNDTISSLAVLRTSGQRRISNFTLNPYLTDECIVATEDGVMRLWNFDVMNRTKGVSMESLQILSNSTSVGLQSSDCWRQACFAAHPRQIYMADAENVCLFDIRSRNSSLSVLSMMNSPHAHKREKVYCIESGRSFGSEFQCLVATDHNIFVMDHRHCGEPLLQLGTNMSYPPPYMKTVKICERECSRHSLNWTHSTFAVLIGNQRAHEVFCYQLCKTSTRDSSQVAPPVVYPYQSIGAPRVIGSRKSLLNFIEKESMEFSSQLRERSLKMIVGLEAIPIQTRFEQEDMHGVIALEITSVGDVGYQTLLMKDPEAVYDMPDIMSGKTCATFTTHEREEYTLKRNEIERENYSRWVEIAGKALKLSSRRTAPHEKLKVCPNISMFDSGVTPPLQSCQLCKNHRTSIYSVTSDAETCWKCGVSVSESTELLELLSKSKFGIITGLSDGDSSVSGLDLVDVGTSEKIHDNEIGRLLKATWDASYEEYWESQRSLKERHDVEERLRQNRLTLDLDPKGRVLGKESEESQRIISTKQSENGVPCTPDGNKRKSCASSSPTSGNSSCSGTARTNVTKNLETAAQPRHPPNLNEGSLLQRVAPERNTDSPVAARSFFSPWKRRLEGRSRKRKGGSFSFSQTSLGF